MNQSILFFISFFMMQLFTASILAQGSMIIAPDLIKIGQEKKITVVNRNMNMLSDAQHKNGIHLDGKPGEGIAWLNGFNFAEGVISFEVRGRNIMQQSFVGIAFHGANDSTYDAVYFRPFNFKAQDSIRRSHAVEYVSMPAYDWPVLRENYPGKYEKPINPAPEPESWIQVRIVIKHSVIAVYVNENSNPCITVTALNNRVGGKIGFWTGNNSEGDFANLKMDSRP